MAVTTRGVAERVFRDQVTEAIDKKMDEGSGLSDAARIVADEMIKGGKAIGLFRECGAEFLAYLWRMGKPAPVLDLVRRANTERRGGGEPIDILDGIQYSPARKDFIEFRNFTRADCLAVVERMDTEITTITHERDLMMAIAKRLTGDETVGSKFTTESLLKLAEKVKS